MHFTDNNSPITPLWGQAKKIEEKVINNQNLSFEDGVALFNGLSI